MEPLIYRLPTGDHPLSLGEPVYCEAAPRPLLKYGYTTAHHLDYTRITADDHYPTSLDIHLDSHSRRAVKKALGLTEVTLPALELWEVGVRMGFWEGVRRILAPGCRTVVQSIGQARGEQWTVDNQADEKADLVIYRLTAQPLEEGVALELTTQVLSSLLTGPRPGGTLCLQLPRLETEATAEMLSYLASQFEEAYLVRPAIMSALSQGAYLVGRGYRGSGAEIPEAHGYLHSLGVPVDPDLDRVLACLAGRVRPARYRQYHRTLSYITGRLYSTALADEYTHQQRQTIQDWLESLMATDLGTGLTEANCPGYPEDLITSERVY